MLLSLGSKATILLVGVLLSRVFHPYDAGKHWTTCMQIFDTKICYFGLISAMRHTTRSSKELFYAIQTDQASP